MSEDSAILKATGVAIGVLGLGDYMAVYGFGFRILGF